MLRNALITRLRSVHHSKLWHWVYQIVAVNLVFVLICMTSTTCEGGSRTPCIRHQWRGLAMTVRVGRLFRTFCLLSFLLLCHQSRPFLIRQGVFCRFLFVVLSLRCIYLFFRFAMNENPSFLSCRGGWRFFCIMQKFTVKTHIIQKKLYCTTIIIY